MEAFPSSEVAAQLDTAVTAEPGLFIVFDSMLFHRAGANVSDRPRRAVNQVFSVPIIAQQVSLPDALDGCHADDPHLARLLGYEVAPPRSVLAWRERRLARDAKRDDLRRAMTPRPPARRPPRAARHRPSPPTTEDGPAVRCGRP